MTRHPELAALEPGDKVALIAPSGPPETEQVSEAVALLRGWGLEPVLGRHVHSRHPRAAYLAGADAERAADLQEAWTDPSVRAVFCIRGGYGTVRLLDLLDTEALRAAAPKPLIGSSDITGLHEFWEHQLGLATWFAPMVATGAVLKQPESTLRLRDAVFGGHRPLSITHADARTLVSGVASGPLTGGNLSLLAMTTGSHPAGLQRTAGKIILLEDVTEEIYRLDGLLQNLIRSGYFDGAQGIVLGTWEECGPLEEVHALVAEALVPLGIPLVRGLRIGHGGDVESVPLGVRATLFADDSPRLAID